MATIFCAFPCYQGVNPVQTTFSLLAMTMDLMRHGHGVGWSTLTFPNIARVRNAFLSYWYYKGDASHILMIDSDMSFDEGLVNKMLDEDQPVVAAVYPKKDGSGDFVGSFLPNEKPNERGFMRVRGSGGGLLLIRRDAIDKLLEHDPTLVREDVQSRLVYQILQPRMKLDKVITAFDEMEMPDWVFNDGTVAPMELSEDISFCHRIREAGMEVWASVTHPIGHVSPNHEFRGCLINLEGSDEKSDTGKSV